MRKTLLWLLLLTLAVVYSIVVYGWVQEGNNRQVEPDIHYNN